jgi:hypothetical protein
MTTSHPSGTPASSSVRTAAWRSRLTVPTGAPVQDSMTSATRLERSSESPRGPVSAAVHALRHRLCTHPSSSPQPLGHTAFSDEWVCLNLSLNPLRPELWYLVHGRFRRGALSIPADIFPDQAVVVRELERQNLLAVDTWSHGRCASACLRRLAHEVGVVRARLLNVYALLIAGPLRGDSAIDRQYDVEVLGAHTATSWPEETVQLHNILDRLIIVVDRCSLLAE